MKEKGQIKPQIIFVSHASMDSTIGEAFVDLLLEFGVEKKNIFFSSKYHLGVELGKDFVSTVKGKLKESTVTIFLITDNFYESAYCLNEMGACWILEKEFIPVLLNNTKFEDMRGFIDQRHIVASVDSDDLAKIYNYLVKRNLANKQCENVKEKCNTFIESIYNIESNDRKKELKNQDVTQIEREILNNRFTIDELIILDYIIENQIIFIRDGIENRDDGTRGSNLFFEQWKNSFTSFDYIKGRSLLLSNNYVKEIQGTAYTSRYVGDDYVLSGTLFSVDYFRDLMNLSDESTKKIKDTVTKHRKLDDNHVILKQTASQDDIEQLIKGNVLEDSEILLLCYLIDTGSYTLGDRWMAEGEINNIKAWEVVNKLNSELSKNYQKTLGLYKIRKFLDVESETSYGNPREFRLRNFISEKMLYLSEDTKAVLNEVKNKYKIEDLPF